MPKASSRIHFTQSTAPRKPALGSPERVELGHDLGDLAAARPWSLAGSALLGSAAETPVPAT